MLGKTPMKSKVKLRPVTKEEELVLRNLARSKKAPAETVRRARLLVYLLDNPDLTPAQAGYLVGFTSFEAGRRWVERFNVEGLSGLEDHARSGRPLVHSKEVREALLRLAGSKPQTLGYTFQRWTLERLQLAFLEKQGVKLAEGTIWKWLKASGMK